MSIIDDVKRKSAQAINNQNMMASLQDKVLNGGADAFNQQIDQMFRLMGTQSAQQSNRMSQINAFNGSPLSTSLATERGISLNSSSAMSEAVLGLNTQRMQQDRSAAQWLMQMFNQNNENAMNRKAQTDAAKMQAVIGGLGSIGRAAGSFFGGGM